MCTFMQQGNLISPLLFIQNKKSTLKMQNMFQEAVLSKHFPWKVMTIYDRVIVSNLMFNSVYSPDFMVIQRRRPHSSVRLLLGNPPSDRISEFLFVVDILYEWSPYVMPHEKWKNVREHSYVCFCLLQWRLAVLYMMWT